MRLRLKESGDWVGGLFRADSYAAGYPEEPQDLSLEQAYEMLADGTFATNDEVPVELGSACCRPLQRGCQREQARFDVQGRSFALKLQTSSLSSMGASSRWSCSRRAWRRVRSREVRPSGWPCGSGLLHEE